MRKWHHFAGSFSRMPRQAVNVIEKIALYELRGHLWKGDTWRPCANVPRALTLFERTCARRVAAGFNP